MDIVFVGVGEAFDDTLPNTSLLVSCETANGGTTALLDCGFTAAASLFRLGGDAVAHELDLIYISHAHGDHFLGLPFLLVRMWQEGRTRPLTIIGNTDIEHNVRAVCELAYPGIIARFDFALQFVVCPPGQGQVCCGLQLRTALTAHSVPCLAVRLEDEKSSLFYSGDGGATPETRDLALHVDAVVHEAHGVESAPSGHGNVVACIDFARQVHAKVLALVHIGREYRQHRMHDIIRILKTQPDILACVPVPGERLRLPLYCNSLSL